MTTNWIYDEHWVTRETVWGIPGKTRKYGIENGYSLEVFHKKQHYSSISSHEALAPVGAEILRISLLPKGLEFSGALVTATPNREPAVSAKIALYVAQPKFFALAIYAGSDPVSGAYQAFETRLYEYTSLKVEQDLEIADMRYIFEDTLEDMRWKRLGLAVAGLGAVRIIPSAQALEFQKMRDENAINRAKSRDEDLIIYEHEMRKKIIEEDVGKIKPTPAMRASLFGNPDMGSYLPGRSKSERLLRGSRQSELFVKAEDESDSGRNRHARSSDTSRSDSSPDARPYSNDDLGVSFALHTLTEEEQEDIGLQSATIFKVTWVYEKGPLSGKIYVGDLLLKANDQPVHDRHTLKNALEYHWNEKDTFVVLVEREEQKLHIPITL